MFQKLFRYTLPNRLALLFIVRWHYPTQKRFRMFEEKHSKAGTWELSTTVLMEMAFLFRRSDFRYYTADVGKQVDVNTGFQNAEDVARRLRRICQLIKEDEPIPDALIGSYKSAHPRLLDDFLITDRGESISVDALLDELRYRIVDFHVLLLERSSHSKISKSYHQRVTKGVLGDVYIILEGLLTAALMR